MLSWTEALAAEKQADYFKAVMAFVEGERQRGITVYPPRDRVFQAFKTTPLEQVKVVILGQDPYHGPNQANGLCFSVHPGIPLPPSLLNIFKELRADLAVPMPTHGDLSCWATQGVLLLNTVLSVVAGTPQSHQGKGWERFTDHVIKVVNQECEHVVFLLWGKPAQTKLSMIDRDKHTVLTSVHPSPLSAHRGFFGCKHFSQANAALIRHGQTPIEWALAATI